MNDVESPVRRRRFLTFSVRTLLVLTTVVAVALALWTANGRGRPGVSAILLVRNAPPGSLISQPAIDPVEARAYRNEQIERLRSDLVFGGAIKEPGIAQLSIIQRQSDPVAWLRANLRIENPNDSEVVSVRLASWRPDEAAKLVNAVVNVYFRDCVWADATNRRRELQESEAQFKAAYEERMRLVRNVRKVLLDVELVEGGAKAKDSTSITSDNPDLNRVKALANEAFMRLEQQKLEADMPSRVELMAPAELPEGWKAGR